MSGKHVIYRTSSSLVEVKQPGAMLAGKWERGGGMYREIPTGMPGVVLWQSDGHAAPTRILPDGCMDLIWDGQRLVIAGPDTTARIHPVEQNPLTFTALRCAAGTGPSLLGVPADAIVDTAIDLTSVWSARASRQLTDDVAENPADALKQLVVEHMRSSAGDPLGWAVLEMARIGLSVDSMADEIGVGVRQLHRRVLPLFGYGPRRLSRVLRLQRAVAAVQAGRPLSAIAVDSGYADQAHMTRDFRELAHATPTQLNRELISR